MSYKLEAGQMYLMPTHFGPSTGPRRGPDGGKFECIDTPKKTTISVSFLTDREQLAALLPEGFEVGKEPIVTVAASYITEIDWLAGRGYNILGVSFPAIFNGKEDKASGSFLTVLWENMTEPILTGREELGFSKIYCELPEPCISEGETHCSASWMGFNFMDLRASNMKQVPSDEIPNPAVAGADESLSGILHYKYIPKTGDWGSADAAYAVMTPAHTPNQVILEKWNGEGTVQFHKATWEELPTQYMIVNRFHKLEVREERGASMVKTIGGKDLSDQRILR